MNNLKLMDEEIQAVQYCWLQIDVPYLDVVLEDDNLQPYFSFLKDHRVVEIGPGKNPIIKHYDCKEYIAALGYYPHDGLSVLKKEDDASAVVVSFGVIDDSVLKNLPSQKSLSSKYIEELVEEIWRVMNPFGIIFGRDAQKYMGEPNIPVIDYYPIAGGIYFPR